MAGLAQILIEAGKKVSGCDVAEDFVTKQLLEKIEVSITSGFESSLSSQIEVVIYTSSHGGSSNPIVKQAIDKNKVVLSHAQAISQIANSQSPIAVCGVGGKSTTSAMIATVLEKIAQETKTLAPSYSVGVGKIVGLPSPHKYRPTATHFVIEADEYSNDTSQEFIPRFLFLSPQTVICTNLTFDHPDVYQDLNHTKQVFKAFFNQILPNGTLIFNADSPELNEVVAQLDRNDLTLLSYGFSNNADAQIITYAPQKGKNTVSFKYQNNTFSMELKVPGKFNAANAVAAFLALNSISTPTQEILNKLSDFQSTGRRFEFIGQKKQVLYYDDYAHHPHEVAATIKALQEWFPQQPKYVIFQPHTFSRTQQLFDQFVDALSNAEEVLLVDIFASARESDSHQVSSQDLVTALQTKTNAQFFGSFKKLAEFCKKLPPNSVVITLGAGDIYQVHDLI